MGDTRCIRAPGDANGFLEFPLRLLGESRILSHTSVHIHIYTHI